MPSTLPRYGLQVTCSAMMLSLPLRRFLDAMQEHEARVTIEERGIKENKLRRRKLAEEFAELQRRDDEKYRDQM